jgi:leucyl aminopeptidase
MADVPQIKVSAKPPIRTDALVMLVDNGRTETDGIDWGYLERVGFEAKVGSHVMVPGDGDLVRILVGMGDRAEVTPDTFRRAGAVAAKAGAKFKRINVDFPDASSELLDPRAMGQALAEGLVSGAYSYDEYKTSEVKLRDIVIVSKLGRELSSGVQRGRVVGEAVAFARDLVNEPGGSATPAALAKTVAERAMAAGLGVKLMDEKAIAKAGMGGLIAVNKGSTQPPRFIQLTYQPSGTSKSADGSGAHLALVGKGITFDSGGLSLKTGDGMMTMKMDKGRWGLGARRHVRPSRAEGPPAGDGLRAADRQHARPGRSAPWRRVSSTQRQDGRGAQHRRRGSPGAGRRPVGGRRRQAGRHHRPGHADRRRHGGAGQANRRADGQQRRLHRPGLRCRQVGR